MNIAVDLPFKVKKMKIFKLLKTPNDSKANEDLKKYG